jgi:DNA helicase HerA-like ATPase
LLKREKEEKTETRLENFVEEDLGPELHYEDIAGTLELGWYWSENKEEYQMAKIAEKDRASHLYVIGATGTGKTKFLEFLIQQDIEKGNGFGVIDPHRDLVEDIKGFLACRYHEYGDKAEVSERVVLIDPTFPDFTVTFNPLGKLPGVSVAEQASELVSAFKKIWSEAWGVRMEDLLRNSLIALGEAELTLAELPHFLTRRAFRQDVLGKVSHPIAQEYF